VTDAVRARRGGARDEVAGERLGARCAGAARALVGAYALVALVGDGPVAVVAVGAATGAADAETVLVLVVASRDAVGRDVGLLDEVKIVRAVDREVPRFADITEWSVERDDDRGVLVPDQRNPTTAPCQQRGKGCDQDRRWCPP
jgi:hypothetical protein